MMQENQETLQAVLVIARLLQLNGSTVKKLSENGVKGNQNVRFARNIWRVLRPVLCGPNEDEYEKDPCPDAMYVHTSNSKALEVMLYLMTNKPLILYSPNGTQVDDVVRRVSEPKEKNRPGLILGLVNDV